MADGANTDVREQGQERIELRISLSGTHTRRDDLEALSTWLRNAPVLEGVLERDEATLTRRDSLTQAEAMGGELIQDIILVVSVEVARSVTENAWRSVETWLRNRRRFADPDETPRVTLDGPPQGPGSDLSRATDDGDPARGAADGPVRGAADDTGGGAPGTDPGAAPDGTGGSAHGDPARGAPDGTGGGAPGTDSGAAPDAGDRNRAHGGDESGEV